MDLNKFNKYLKKINNFETWDSISEIQLSKIEKDLLKEYIRNMYDAIVSDKDETHMKLQTKKIKKSEPTYDEKKIEVKVEPVVQEPIAEVKQTESVKESPKAEITPEIKSEEIPEPQTIKNYQVSAEFNSLFEDSMSTELSEKLSKTPLSDLAKAFGLNEKIFTVNELFGGDIASFDNAINSLNSMTNIESAKEFIIENLVSKYNWDTESKLKKAEYFIKRVKRRYL